MPILQRPALVKQASKKALHLSEEAVMLGLSLAGWWRKDCRTGRFRGARIRHGKASGFAGRSRLRRIAGAEYERGFDLDMNLVGIGSGNGTLRANYGQRELFGFSVAGPTSRV